MTRLLVAAALAALIAAPACRRAQSAGEAPQVIVLENTSMADESAKPDAKPEPKPVEVVSAPAAFAGDLGSQVLARALAPQLPAPAAERRTRPLGRRPAPAVEQPEIPSPLRFNVSLKVSLPPRAEPRPWPPADLVPLLDYTAEPAPPQRPELPKGKLVRTPSRDVNLPPELPAQAKYQPDRASLEDPAAEHSVAAARAATISLRDRPAPFVRIDLPEPFGPRAYAAAPEPEPSPAAPTPQPPK